MKTFRLFLAMTFLAFGLMASQAFAVDEETAGGAAAGAAAGAAVGGPIGAGIGAGVGGAAGAIAGDAAEDEQRRDADVPGHAGQQMRDGHMGQDQMRDGHMDQDAMRRGMSQDPAHSGGPVPHAAPR